MSSPPSDLTKAPPRTGAGVSVFVWICWALMVYAAFTFVARYASQVPYSDDWNSTAVYTGEQPFSLGWLWEQDREWREVLPKLIFILLGKASRFDLRWPLFLNAFLFGGLAFALIRTTRHVRGEMRLSDAFFPLALLHWGHTRPFLQTHYLIYAVYIALFVGVLLVILRHPKGPSLPSGVVAGLCLVGLPLCGAVGVAVIPPLLLWLGYVGIRRIRESSPHGRREGILLLSLAAFTTGLTGLYFVGYQWPPENPASPGLTATLSTAAQFLSMSLGPFGQASWPFSAVGVILLSLTSVAVLLAAWKERPEERIRTAGLLLSIGAMGILALSIGFGRSGFRSDFGFGQRYITASTPLLCVIYVVWVVAGPPRLGRVVQYLLFGLMLVLLPYNARFGRGTGNTLTERKQALMKDVHAGLSPQEVAARHWHGSYQSEGKLRRFLEMMRKARIGPYREGK